MKALLVMGLLTITTSAFSAVVKSYDADHACTLYRVTTENPGEKIKMNANESVVFAKGVYGLTFQDMEINFDNRDVKVQVTINVVMGLNKSLVTPKSTISSENTEFTTLVNQLNRKLNSLEKVCLSSDNRVVFAKQFENKN